MEKTYSIKQNKVNQNNGEKYYVIQEFRCKSPLVKYEKRMKRYRSNLLRDDTKRKERQERFKELFEIVEETIEKKIKIVTSKPNPSKGTKTDIVFEWTPEAKAAKAELANQKTTKTITWIDEQGNQQERIIRHRTVWTKADTKMKYKNCISKNDKLSIRYLKDAVDNTDKLNIAKSNKERRELAKQQKIAKYSARERSEKANAFILSTYSTPNDSLKKAAIEAAHESKIQKLMKEIREKKLSKFKYRLEFRKFDSTHNPIVFIKNYSNKSLSYLYDMMNNLSAKIVDKIEDFICINIYDNATNTLLRVCTGWNATSKDYEMKLKELKRLYPDYYTSTAA